MAGGERIGAELAGGLQGSENLTVWLQETQGIGVSPVT
jgi:hypothetical protein